VTITIKDPDTISEDLEIEKTENEEIIEDL